MRYRLVWELQLDIDATGREPVYGRIARAVAADIARGRLRPGERLPGTRRLAESLGVHRNTVLSAFRELDAEGWVEAREGSGTYVAEDMPLRPAVPFAAKTTGDRSPAPGFAMEMPPPARLLSLAAAGRPSEFVLAGGLPDLRLLPAELLARAYRRGVRRAGRRLLAYGDPRGEPRLREALARMLSATRGLAVDPEDVIVTRGSQMGMFLASRLLIRPGDRVAVEGFGYEPAWATLRAAGAELVPIPVDTDGIDVAAVRAAADEAPLRAVYLTPHHQYPTTAVLSASRRGALLELAATRRIAVLEDDYDNEFHYEGRPILPLASADPGGVVVYLGTFSKVLAPGLRLGWLVARPDVVEGVARLRAIVDRQGDRAVEHAVAELLEDGEVVRHVRRMRRTYQRRRDALSDALEDAFGDRLSFDRPRGGMNLWARAHDVDVDRWRDRCEAAGVRFATGGTFAFDRRPVPFVRLGFAPHDPAELRAAVARMRRALPRS